MTPIDAWNTGRGRLVLLAFCWPSLPRLSPPARPTPTRTPARDGFLCFPWLTRDSVDSTADATCVSVQCRYCQQVRAKNTTRQRAHLLKCAPYRAAHPDAAIFHQAEAEDAVDDSIVGVPGIAHNGNGNGNGDSAGPDSSFAAQVQQPANFDMADHTALGFTPNPRINSTPLVPTPGSAPPMHHPRPSLDGTPAAKKQKLATGAVRKSIGTTGTGPATGKPEIPLADVHAAFEEFKVNPEDKTVSARCRYCNNTRAKNTSRQRDHLMTCAGYQDILRERIPANHLRYQFDEHDVASSLALPVPNLSLDFRLSIRVKPTLHLGESKFGDKAWVSCVGGQWAGRWGKGVVLVGSLSSFALGSTSC